jgi:hypothetical protein
MLVKITGDLSAGTFVKCLLYRFRKRDILDKNIG